MGGDASVKTFFSWLGITYYLSTEAINTMLAALSELCADGSSLVFDYPDENFFDASEKRVQNTIMMAKAGDEPMQSAFSYSEIEKLLEKHGFLIFVFFVFLFFCCFFLFLFKGILSTRQGRI